MAIGGILFLAGASLAFQSGLYVSRHPVGTGLATVGGAVSWWARARYKSRLRAPKEGET